jgi:hypothetical protein
MTSATTRKTPVRRLTRGAAVLVGGRWWQVDCVEDQRDGFVILVVKRDDPATVTTRYSNIVLPAGAIVDTRRDGGGPRHVGGW